MALDKAIASGKERRAGYRRSAAFDRTCRPHGGCPWCEGNRTARARRAEQAARDSVAYWFEYGKRERREWILDEVDR